MELIRWILFILLPCIVFAALPACFMDRYLQKWLRPKRSLKNFILYLAVVFLTALAYAGLAFVLLDTWVWPIK